MDIIPTFEDILVEGSKNYIRSGGMRRSRYHQADEDLIQMQKEFASEIYIQRCLDFGK